MQGSQQKSPDTSTVGDQSFTADQKAAQSNAEMLEALPTLQEETKVESASAQTPATQHSTATTT